MVVLFGCGYVPKSLVVLLQILLLQKLVGGRIGFDLFPPQLLHQPVLVRAVIALHAPFRLCRVGCDDSSPQPRTHLPKLRLGHIAPQQLLLCRLLDVNRLPVGIQSQWHAVVLNPAPQHSDCRPDRLLLADPPQRRARGIIHHVH
jgi:hypothetical protein